MNESSKVKVLEPKECLSYILLVHAGTANNHNLSWEKKIAAGHVLVRHPNTVVLPPVFLKVSAGSSSMYGCGVTYDDYKRNTNACAQTFKTAKLDHLKMIMRVSN